MLGLKLGLGLGSTSAVEQLGPELITVLDFTTGWTTAETGSIVDIDTFASTAAGGIFRTDLVVIGNTYKVETVGSSTATFNIRNGDVSQTYASGFGIFTFTAAVDNFFYLRNNNTGTTDITTISLKQVL